jgi:hypothetical protein
MFKSVEAAQAHWRLFRGWNRPGHSDRREIGILAEGNVYLAVRIGFLMLNIFNSGTADLSKHDLILEFLQTSQL